MKNNANKIVKLNSKTDEHKSHLALQESVGGLATITDEKLEIISKKILLPKINIVKLFIIKKLYEHYN